MPDIVITRKGVEWYNRFLKWYMHFDTNNTKMPEVAERILFIPFLLVCLVIRLWQSYDNGVIDAT